MIDVFETLEKNYIKYGKIKIHVIIDKNDELWFNATDTALALGYSDTRGAIRAHVKKKDISQIQYIDYDYKKVILKHYI